MFAQKKNIYIDMQNQANVLSSNKVDLVVLIYDKIILELNKTVEAIDQKAFDKKAESISKILQIIEVGLLSYLDLSQGEVAKNLEEFYLSAIFGITGANIKNDIDEFNKIKDSFVNLREAWKEISVAQTAW